MQKGQEPDDRDCCSVSALDLITLIINIVTLIISIAAAAMWISVAVNMSRAAARLDAGREQPEAVEQRLDEPASGDRDANRLNDDSDSIVYYDLVPGKDYSFTWG